MKVQPSMMIRTANAARDFVSTLMGGSRRRKNEYITPEKIASLEQDIQQVLAHLRNLSEMDHRDALYGLFCQESLDCAQQLSQDLLAWQLLLDYEIKAGPARSEWRRWKAL